MLFTLPQLAVKWRESLDRVRALVRNNPDLRTLGTKIGPTRCFSDAEAERIREALKAKTVKAGITQP